MKKLVAIVIGILIVSVIVLAFNNSAVAGPGGKHGKHWGHGGHWGHGQHLVYGGSWGYWPQVADDECYTVKRCWVNSFGQRQCRFVRVCD